MSSLSVFPVEILECITSVVTTSQQVRLWQCGDRILNIKLKNGGLKRTSLCWSGCTWMPWPRSYFTTYGGIVDVEWGMSIGRSLCPTLELNLLPKTLKRLHLACDDVFILLRQQNVNMNDMLPSLQSLYLSGRHLREENLKHLPSNLIELHVASGKDKIESSCIFSDLPRQITRLTFNFKIEDKSELEDDIPSELVSLDIRRLDCYITWFSKLPKSLKILKIASLEYLPKSLTLPPQLEELWLPIYPKNPRSFLLQLPQSLKVLEGVFTGGLIDNELVALLPKNLTKFVGGEWDSFDHSGVQQLPASLTDFDIDLNATHPDILSYVNPETTKLQVTKGPYSSNMNISSFPTKLQYLRLNSINDEICAMLPPELREISVSGGLITTKGASKLPKSLTTLGSYFEVLDDNQTISYLRQLSQLRLTANRDRQLCNMNKNWLYSLLPSNRPTNSNEDFIPTTINVNGVNSHLTSLIIRGGSGLGLSYPLIQKPFFEALPQFINLNTLKLSNFGDISSDWLGLIPQNITNLEISFLTAYPTATQLSMLPKCLCYLNLQVCIDRKPCEWKDETLQSLPRLLQKFVINGPFPNLTERMYEYLPCNLRKTSLEYRGSSEKLRYIAPLNRMYEDAK